MEIHTANTPESIALCWEAMHLLRPHLVKEEFVGIVTEMIGAGYTLAYIREPDRPGGGSPRPAVAAIGFRELQFLLHGKHIYIDDLTTLPGARKMGYAGMLLDYVFGLAAARGMKVVTLDSGPARHDAHRLYLNKGFTLASHHFTRVTD